MKKMKRMQAILLAFIMVVMGILVTPTEGEKAQAEETATQDVNTDMLQVKVQFGTKGGEDIIRFVSSVDSLEYSKVGFDIQASNGEEFPYESQRVFKRIDTTNSGGVQYDFSPKVVDTSSKYFITANMYIDANVTYTVRAYVIPLNSTEKVYGNSRCVSLSDATSNTTVNVSFETTDTTIKQGNTINNVTYGTNGDTSAEVIDVDVKEGGNTVHARVTIGNKNSLPSVTKFTFGEAGSAIYRNLYTTHKPAEGTTPVADTSWYDVDQDAEEFVLATTADLYGLAEIVNTTDEDFQGHTIYLVSDMKLNETGDKTYAWTQMGSYIDSTKDWFQGVFDGQMQTISGVHVNNSTSKSTGFFSGVTGENCEIKNFSLVDSSFESTYGTSTAYAASTGSVAGYGNAKFENISSSAQVTANRIRVGGLVGIVGTSTETWKVSFIKCNFTGSVNAYNYAGGIVGYVCDKRDVNFEQCQFMGSVTAYRFFGGIVGYVATSGSKVQVDNCMSAGTLTTTNNNGIGGICGNTEAGTTVTINNSVSKCTMYVPSKYSSGSVLSVVAGSAYLNKVYTKTQTYLYNNKTQTQALNTNTTYAGVSSNSSGTVGGTGSYEIDESTVYDLDTSIWTTGSGTTIPVLKIFAQ